MFELAMPWVLVFVLLPPIIWFSIPRAPVHLPVALKVPFFNALLPVLDRQERVPAHPSQTGLLFIIWALVLFALAGPRWVGQPMPVIQEGRNIMLVLDLSGSMELADMLMNDQPVSRLSVVKQAARQFVQARTGDRIGLILFGSQAYLQTPLTFDRNSVVLRIDDATAGLAGQSTAIGDALGLAVKRLQDVPHQSRVIILLTDGANNAGVLLPSKAAELAKADGIKVYTIGLGSEVDAAVMNNPLFPFNAGTDLDEHTLQAIAKMTGGRYFRATDTQSLHSIYGMINTLETVGQDAASVRPQKEFYPWPLGLALMLFVFWLGKQATWPVLSRMFFDTRGEERS